MKRTFLNLGAILVAFIIGLAINNACADSLENMTDSELRKLVAQLQQEVNSLKSRVADLEGKVGSNSGGSASVSAGMFNVDGLWFLPSGSVCSRVKSSKGTTKQTYLGTGETTTTNTFTTMSSSVDSQGRLIRCDYTLPEGYEYYYQTYSYQGKVVKSTTSYKTTYYESIAESETEYY